MQAYPIFVAIGGACAMCAAQCGRQLFSSPDVRIQKSERSMGVLEDKQFFREGERFREHSLRRCVVLARSHQSRPAGSAAARVICARFARGCFRA